MADQQPKLASPFSGLDKALLRSSQPQPVPAEKPAEQPTRSPSRKPAKPQATQPESEPASQQASMLAVDEETIEAIRKAVKVSGKEVVYTRLTREEKDSLADIVHTYKRQGTKTTENEIARIALNSLLIDYRAHGERSVLARVIAALLA